MLLLLYLEHIFNLAHTGNDVTLHSVFKKCSWITKIIIFAKSRHCCEYLPNLTSYIISFPCHHMSHRARSVSCYESLFSASFATSSRDLMPGVLASLVSVLFRVSLEVGLFSFSICSPFDGLLCDSLMVFSHHMAHILPIFFSTKCRDREKMKQNLIFFFFYFGKNLIF